MERDKHRTEYKVVVHYRQRIRHFVRTTQHHAIKLDHVALPHMKKDKLYFEV